MGTLDDSDVIRVCVFRPYRRGMGPSFRLTVWDTHRYDRRGQTILGYRLTMHVHAERTRTESVDLFEAEDFSGSPMHADDSDATMASLMGFLTLRPGDTDQDFFASDTEVQTAYRRNHAGALGMAVMNRFGEDY